jgi:putative tryptophan/tyrosine transport system substrate-binding protein
MRRREFLRVVGGVAAAWPLAARAQQATRRVIGVLSAGSESTYTSYIGAIVRGLKETGFTEGQNIHIEYRWADTKLERLPALAADLVGRNVSLIITSGGVPPAMAAKTATSSIPIVFHMGDDPVRLGMVASLNHPGGNITGVSFLTVASGTKRLELLNALVPKAKSIGLLVNPENPGAGPTQNELREAARALGFDLNVVGAQDPQHIDEAFAQFAAQHVEAVILAPDALFRVQLARMVSLAERLAIPTMYATRDFAEAGGLVSYGADIVEAYHQEGIYAGRILQGDKPGDLPIMQSVKFELVINIKTAKALGLNIPATLLALADEVIE